MSSLIVVWPVFLILLTWHTWARRRAAGGAVPHGNLMISGMAGTMVAAVALGGPAHASAMAVIWGVVAAFGVPDFVPGKSRGRAGVAPKRSAASGKTSGKTSGVAPGKAAAGRDLHMDRASRGEISLDEYFKEGERESREWNRRLQGLAVTPEIAAVLTRRKLSMRGFLALREQLVEARDLEWEILSDPKALDRLIRLVESRRSTVEIGAAFRSLRARPAAG